MQPKSLKNILSVSIFLVITTLFQSCFIVKSSIVVEPSHVRELKSGKVIIATTEYPKKASLEDKQEIDRGNALAVEIIKKNWTFCPIAEVMPLEEAKKFVSGHEGCFILTLETVNHSYKEKYLYVERYSEAVTLYLSNANFFGGHALRYDVPYTHLDKLVNPLSLQIALSDIQHKVYEIDSGELKNSLDVAALIKSRSEILKTQTLLIPEFMIHKKLSIEKIQKYYPYKFEICDNKKYEEVIFNHTKGYVYPVLRSCPVGKTVVQFFYIYSSATGECCALQSANPSVDTNIDNFESKFYHENVRLEPKEWKRACSNL